MEMRAEGKHLMMGGVIQISDESDCPTMKKLQKTTK
jgi:hypothetical protein